MTLLCFLKLYRHLNKSYNDHTEKDFFQNTGENNCDYDNKNSERRLSIFMGFIIYTKIHWMGI